jgi:hypothetical protein
VGNDFHESCYSYCRISSSQAFPCLVGNVKEYRTGYHDGAVQGYPDYKKGHDPGIDVHLVVVLLLLLQWV